MRAALALLLAAWAAFADAAAEDIVIRLHAEASVAAEHALLGDVAVVEGEAATAATLRAVAVQTLPDLGARTVGEREVRSAIGRLAAGRSVRIEGGCRVARAALTLDTERLLAAATAQARRGHAEAEIEVVRPPAPLVVPDGGDAVELVAEPLTDNAVGEVPMRIRALRAGRELGRGLAVLRVRVWVEQVVAARGLPRGVRIDAADVRLERREARANDDAVTDAGLVVGWTTRLAIAEGSPVTRRHAAPPPAVQGARAVELLFVRGDFAIAAVGTALSDGAIGDVIQVRRGTDGKVVQAKVVADGRVQANF